MLNWLRRFAASLIPTSTASRAATTTAAFLVTIILAAAFLLRLRNDSLWDHLHATGTTILAALVSMITGLVYAIFRFWGEAEEEGDPEIDRAWRAGIEALESVGISMSKGSVPLFLVLGGGSVETAFAEHMQASGIDFSVKRVPSGEGLQPALRWYACKTAIYLFSSDVGALAKLARNWTTCSREEGFDLGQSLDAGALMRRASGKSGVNHLVKSVTPDALGDDDDDDSQISPEPPKNIGLPMQVDLTEPVERISYLCRLIKRARWPRCGLNGLVVLLPFEITVARPEELGAVVKAIRADMGAIHRTLWLRYPVIGVMTGMEQAVGFNEFARLLGTNIAINMRLGSGFSVHRSATVERLQWLSDRICDAFEDFLYALFKRPAALANPAENRKLYHLMCRVRQQIKPQLTGILAPAFGKSGSLDRDDTTVRQDGRRAVYFGGCYLAATGSAAEAQAFIKGVLYDKLKDEEHRVEWTDEAQRVQNRFKLAVRSGWAVFAALSALLCWLLVELIMS